MGSTCTSIVCGETFGAKRETANADQSRNDLTPQPPSIDNDNARKHDPASSGEV